MKTLSLITAAIAAATLGAPTDAATVVVPTGLDSIEGNSGSRNVLGFINVARMQQVFNADQFLIGPTIITSVSFRANGAAFGGIFGGPGTAFSRTTQGFQLQLSTTSASADNLSANFAANIGSNVIDVVPRSNVTYSSSALSSNGTTRDFDVTFNFVNSFLYDPTRGNLLLDITSFNGSDRSGTTLDGQSVVGDGTSSLFLQNGTSGTGATSTFGYVAQFGTADVAGAVPEPASWAMMIIGFGAVGATLRRKNRVTSRVQFA